MTDGYDSDIARAIAMSLQDTGRGPKRAANPEVIDLSEDAEEEEVIADEEARFQAEIQRAIEQSKREAKSTTGKPSPGSATPTATATTEAPATAFLSERAQLEKARLERLKRQRPDLHRESNTVVVDDDSDDEQEQARGAKSSSSSQGTTAAASARVRPVAGSSSSSSTQNIFWKGELRQTANKHVDPQKDKRPVFRLTEIISPEEEIDFAIVSAFCWDFPWMYSLFDRRTPVIAVDHSQTEDEPQSYINGPWATSDAAPSDASIKAILPNWIRTTPFLRGGRGCMHMKFMLLFYNNGRLRIVVSTANFVPYDWRDIENSVWVQDVPRLAAPAAVNSKEEDFASALVRVLHAVNVAPALVNLLRNDHPNLPLQRIEDLRTHWDFSKVKAALIPSIAGKHEGWPKVILTGHTRLMKAMIDIGATAPKNKELVLECQGSSIGTYSTQWLNEFYSSARGDSAQAWLDKSKASRAKLPFPPVKILFPTAQFVKDSVLGEAGGGTMFCRRNQWEGKNFPRELFHQTKSKRGRVLMHSKLVLGTFRDKRSGGLGRYANTEADSDSENEGSGSTGATGSGSQQKLAGWVYVGSHNFTPSAWGTLSGSGFNPTLNIMNYELGVLIPLRTEEEIDKATCWERPPLKYVAGRDMPWIQSESPAFVEQ